MRTCLGKSGEVRLGHRQNKYSTSTIAPCCITITLLNCTAYIEILIITLVLLAAKADFYVWDLCSEKSCFCEAKHADHKNGFILYFIPVEKLTSNNRASICNTEATPLQPQVFTTAFSFPACKYCKIFACTHDTFFKPLFIQQWFAEHASSAAAPVS